jgi:TatD DNase family protein
MTRPLHVDSHAHLDLADFDPDREAVIARARQAGVRYVLLIADLAKPESVRKVTELVELNPDMYWAAGIDPHESAAARDEHFERLVELARHPKFLAVGEIGLDYYYDYPREVQHAVFLRQLQLARAIGKPAIIHCRDAWTDLRQIMHERPSPDAAPAPGNGQQSATRSGILHCFTGTAEDALDLVGLGFYVSFAGNLTFKKAENLRAAAREIPVDRLLSETDCPYLAPAPHRGRRNEPALVVEVARELGNLRSLREVEMGARLTANFEELFQLPAAPEPTDSKRRAFRPAPFATQICGRIGGSAAGQCAGLKTGSTCAAFVPHDTCGNIVSPERRAGRIGDASIPLCARRFLKCPRRAT